MNANQRNGISDKKAAGKRGRIRSKAADESILRATLEALADNGYENLTANDIISRAGVSSATLYRRHGSLAEVVTAALQSLGPDPVTIDNGCFETDLAEFIRYLGGVLSRDNRSAHWPASSKVDRKLREAVDNTFVSPRKAVLQRILETAAARGEISVIPDIDDSWSLISGPIHHRIFIRNQRFTAKFAETLTIIACAGLKALRPG